MLLRLRAGHRVPEPLALLTPDERHWKVPVAKLGSRDAQHSGGEPSSPCCPRKGTIDSAARDCSGTLSTKPNASSASHQAVARPSQGSVDAALSAIAARESVRARCVPRDYPRCPTTPPREGRTARSRWPGVTFGSAVWE